MRYFFRVEYDGSLYGGWQRQTGTMSVQEKLETVFSTVLRQPCKITGAGRTDAGVHARSQGVHFDIDCSIDCTRCELSVNSMLPSDIAVSNIKIVPEEFHARYSAVKRVYKYYISERKSPLLHKRVWMLNYNIDWSSVEKNLDFVRGVHDFTSFCASGSTTNNNMCHVENVSLMKTGTLYVITIEANRFIYKMVRTIVGTVIDIGRGRMETSLDCIIKSKDRRVAGHTAPPHGLVLENVLYPGGE